MKMIYDTTDLRGLFEDDEYQYCKWIESRLKRSADTSNEIQWDIDSPEKDDYPLGI